MPITIQRPSIPVPLPLTRGGTEATTAPGARTALGLGDLAVLTAPGGTTTFLRADKTWAVPPGGGGGGGDVSSSTGLSVDSELALFEGTTGKLLKRGTGTGLARLTSGVLGTVAAPAGAVVGTTDTQTLTGKTLSGASNTLTVRDVDLAFSDVTTANVSTTQHGLTPKAPGGTTQFLRGDATWAVPAAGGGAPTDAEYITSTTHATLTAERVLTDTATVTWDRTTAGQMKANATAGATTFLGLSDTPDTYTSQGGLQVRVNAGATALEFAALPAASETASGLVELATTAEATAGTDMLRAVTPAGLAAKLPLTTKGDLVVRDASALTRLPVGTDNQVLTADAAQTLGVKWATPAGSTNYWTRTTPAASSYMTGLLAWWRLEEASGNRVDSVTSLALVPQGTPAQVTNAAGKTGQAVRFNATTGTYLRLADTAQVSVGTTQSFTIACWVYFDAGPTTDNGIVGKGDVSSTQNTCEYHWYYSAGAFRFVVGNGANRVDRAYPGLTPASGVWYFLVGWWDSATNTQYLQVNGGMVDSVANTFGSYDSTLPFEVGRQLGYTAAASYMNGRVDNIMFWRRILTAQERADLYNGGSGVDYSTTSLAFVQPATATDRLVLASASTSAERLEVDGGIKVGTTTGTTDGILRWSGSDFEARVGGAWLSLTTAAPAGATTQAQWNNAGALAGSSGLTLSATQVTGIAYADPAAGRGALGLGTMATQNADAVAITGGSADLSGTFQSRGAAFFLGQVGAYDRSGNDQYGYFTNLNAAGGTNRYAVYANGTAPSYFGGTVQVVGQLGVQMVPQANIALRLGFNKATQYGLLIQPLDNDTTAPAVQFSTLAGGSIGSITTTATATSYNTSSDVRLKHAVATLAGALARVQALRPVQFLWNADESPGVGFLAHELQQTIPEAVTGEPDAVNPDGSVKPQQVDHSKLVPWLTSAVQAVLARVEILEAHVSALQAQLTP